MNNKKLITYLGCALAMALTIAATPANVFAAEVDPATVTPTTGSAINIDPTADDPNIDGTDETYAETDIDVLAFSQNIKYSVDVEWGAMTFEYKAEWDPEQHKMKDEGSKWVIYDSANNTEITGTEDAINKVTITNHSNAGVYAKLSYTGEATYTDTTGTFANPASDTGNVNATWTAATDTVPAYYTLESAVGSDGAAGTAAVGNAYFMPENISPANKTSGITKWTKIGKITVAITTDDPTPETTP